MPGWAIDLILWIFNLLCNGAAYHEKTQFKVGSCHHGFRFPPQIHSFIYLFIFVLSLYLLPLNFVTSLRFFLQFLFLTLPYQVLVKFLFWFGVWWKPKILICYCSW